MIDFRNEEERMLTYRIQIQLVRAMNSLDVTEIIKEVIEGSIDNENIAKGQSPDKTV